MLVKKKEYRQRINKALSGVAVGSVLMGGVMPVYQAVSEGATMTVEAASDVAPKVLQEGDRVTQSSHGLKFVDGSIERLGLKKYGNIELKFEIVEGVKNNSKVPLILRLQTTNLNNISFSDSIHLWKTLSASGADLVADGGGSIGEFREGYFHFNDRVEDYVGSTISLRMENLHVYQFRSPEEESLSIDDTAYWDIIIGDTSTREREIIGVMKEEGKIWAWRNNDKQEPRVTNSLVSKDGQLYLGLFIQPGNENRVTDVLHQSNAPLTYRIKYDTSYFGDLSDDQKAVLEAFDVSYKLLHSDYKIGFVNTSKPIPGYADTKGADIQKIAPGVYEFTIEDPLGSGIGEDVKWVGRIDIPIRDSSVIDMDTLKFKKRLEVTTYQNGQLIGSSGNNPDQYKIPLDYHDVIARNTAHVTADINHKDEREVEALPFETIRRDNPDLPVGEERAAQQGVEGEVTRTYSVLYINGRPTDTKELKSEQVTKKPVDHIIEVGAGVISESIDVKVQEIPYETERIENPELPAGEERVVQQGVVGSKSITTTIPTIDGKPNGDPVVTEKVTKQPVNEIIEVGVGTVDQTVDTKTESIPYESETVYDENLPEGERVIDQAGIPGEKTITTTTPTLNGQPNGQPTVNEEITKQPVKEIIRVGSGILSEDVKIDTAEIPFDTEYRENRDLPQGVEQVVQEGQLGSLTITTTIPTLNGQPHGESMITEEVTKEPVNKIIDVGTGIVGEHIDQETIDIPFETERISNPDLPKGEERIVQEGEYGSLLITTTTPTLNDLPSGNSVITEEVTKDPIKQVIEVGTGVVGEDVSEEREVIPYETEYVYDGTLPEGEEVIDQVGEEGELIIITTTPTLNGQSVGESVIEEVLSKDPVNEIIRVGMGEVGQDIKEDKMELPFETEYRQNPDLPEGEERIIQEGELGEKVFITTTPTLNGIPSGPMKVEEKITKEPVTQIIEIGAGDLSEEIVEEKVDIPFETQYRENPELPEGEERIVQEGVPGEITIITTTPTLNGEPIGEPVTDEKVTKEPIPQIIEVGVGSLSEDIQEEIVDIPFETEIVYDENLPEGEEVIERVGESGELTITTTTPTLNGQPAGESTTTEEVTKEPVAAVIRAGSGVESEEVRVEQKEVSYETKEIEDPNLPMGERVVEQRGVTGILTITTKTPTLNGQPNGDPVVEEVITREAQDEIIRVGTGSIASPQSDNKPDQKPEPQQTQPEPDQKPDVKTGVESVATNPTLLATLVASITGLFATLGITIRRKKK